VLPFAEGAERIRMTLPDSSPYATSEPDEFEGE
jgi:hypothetical protein